MKKIIIWIVVIVIIIAAAILLGDKRQGPVVNGESIEIGAISALTGGAAIIGEQARNAIQLAQEEINKNGGIGGRKLDVIFEDGGCNGAKTASAWQKLVSIDKVKVILGGHCSTETLTLAPLAEKNGIIALANITSATIIPSEGEWLFRNSPPNDYYAQIGGKFSYEQGVKALVLLTEQKDYSIDYSKNFRDSFVASGGIIESEDSFLEDTTDFRSLLTKLKDKNFDGVLLSSQSAKTMGLIVNQMRDLGLVDKTFIFSGGFNVNTFLEATGGYAPTKAWGIAPYVDIGLPETKKFLDSYQSRFNQPITFNTFYVAASYDMVFRLKAALEQCGLDENNIDCLKKYFKDQKEWNGVSGKITFGVNTRPMVPLAQVLIIDGKERDIPFDVY